MINFVPLTAVTSILFDAKYVKEEYNNALSKLYDGVEMAWKGYVVADRAIIDPNGAWDDAKKLISYELDAALSLSQLLYFISTRKEFSASESGGSDSSIQPSNSMSSSSSACELHPDCVDLGLSGECCPTAEGTMLGCCGGSNGDSSGASNEAPPTATEATEKSSGEESGSSTSGSCLEHPNCVDAELTGLCCPTEAGDFLECCS